MSYRKQLLWLPSYVTVYLLYTPQWDLVIGIKDLPDNRIWLNFHISCELNLQCGQSSVTG